LLQSFSSHLPFPGLASSLCFNLDTDQPTTFLMESAGFGYSVVQYANSWVVVGAPQEIKAANQTGSLYQCDYRTGKCEPIRLKIPPEAVNMSLGLSLAASTNPSQLLAQRLPAALQGECWGLLWARDTFARVDKKDIWKKYVLDSIAVPDMSWVVTVCFHILPHYCSTFL
uniref:Uncharacterized protein n=1 Tax=Panthera tigris altaica TaxID=74533 RepID=A0A8C9JVC3_PANTA